MVLASPRVDPFDSTNMIGLARSYLIIAAGPGTGAIEVAARHFRRGTPGSTAAGVASLSGYPHTPGQAQAMMLARRGQEWRRRTGRDFSSFRVMNTSG